MASLNRTKGDKALDTVNYILLALFGFVCLYPFLNIIALSFNTGTDSMRGGITIWPREFTLANYAVVFRTSNILGAFKVTIAKTVIGTLGSLFVTAIAAYALSEKALPFKKGIMVYFLIPMFFSGGLIPTYLVYKSVGLLNTFWIYIIPALFSIYNCIVMKTFFQGIPISLKEAIRIDGGHEFTILRHVILPVSMPTFAALGLFTAVAQWNEWFAGMYFVQNNNLIPVQTFLMQIMDLDLLSQSGKSAQVISAGMDARLIGGFAKISSMSLKMAIVMIGTAPILVVYPFVQKYFVKGVLIGSIKE